MNKSIIIGRVGKKPELKKTTTGACYTNFRVATEENWKDKDGKKHTRTDWHSIKAWGKLAEAICEYVVQGQKLEIIGPHRTDEVKDKEDDKKTNYYEYILAREVEFKEKPKAYWDAVNAQKNGQPVPPPATPPANKQPTLAQLMQQMAEMQKVIQSLAGASMATPGPEEMEEDYSAGPHDSEEYNSPPDLAAGL